MPPKKQEDKFYLGNKNLPTADMEFKWTPKMVRELKKSQQNILYFAENFFYIVNLDKGKMKIPLYKGQKRVLRTLRDNRFVACLASRQTGKTTMMTIYALWIACFQEDQRILVVANKEQTAINIFKIIHIVGFVSWFAGIFYLVRIMVYHTEAAEKTASEQKVLQDQFKLMQRRVYKIIMNPAMVLTYIGGLTMIGLYEYNIPGWFSSQSWLHVKLLLLILQTLYHLLCKKIMFQIEAGTDNISPMQFRMLNEVPTLFLIFISTLAIFKNNINYGYTFLTILGFVGLLIFLTKLYKRIRDKNPNA